MYSPAEINQIRARAEALNLRAPRRFYTMSAEKLAGIANGYGPDRWPEKARKILTWIFRYYPEPAAIHDVRYEYSSGHSFARYLADAEFAANLTLCWKARYGKWRYLNPVALYARFKLRTAARLCAKFGASAWQAAYRERKNAASDSESAA